MTRTVDPLVAVADTGIAEALFDLVPDVVFFVKDGAGRYIRVNHTLVARCGRKAKAEVIGQTGGAFFPAELAEAYAAQDRQVLSTGRPILEKLELHMYPDRRPGWCLTSKLPLRNAAGRVCALAGLSRDLAAPDERREIPAELAEAIHFLQENFAQPISTAQLAAKAGAVGRALQPAGQADFPPDAGPADHPDAVAGSDAAFAGDGRARGGHCGGVRFLRP